MAVNFNANQYDPSFRPKVLKNWEVPKPYSHKPVTRAGRTKIISNPRGHLLPEIRRTDVNPWGSFLGTWELPKKIDRKTANEINGLNKTRGRCYSKAKHEIIQDIINEAEVNRKVTDPINVFPEDNKTDKLLEPYIPGDLTDEKYKLDSHEDLCKTRHNADEQIESKGYPRVRDDFTTIPEQKPENLTEEVQDMYKKHQEMLEADVPVKSKPKSSSRLNSPILAAISNFSLAKKLHKENLEHEPLPDTITHKMFRKLQMERNGKEPGLALEPENYVTGIGWKGYSGYGPNRCTKMKVFRPKTCIHNKILNQHENRPSSVSSFDRKWRFIRQGKVSPIDLAICWDLTPEDPKDEPKRTTHIDGSNGSSAPAVFSLVHTPKENEPTSPPEVKCDGIHACAPVFEHTKECDVAKEFILDRPKTSSIKSGSLSNESIKKRAKSACNLNEIEEISSVSSKSIPDLTKAEICKECQKNAKFNPKQKPNPVCMACKIKNISIKEKPAKSDYKMAFKAGQPQRNNSKRQDYPEHWRLATVYQQSYKPIELRKRSLLATVYK